jgi:hypothetical protein
MTTFEYTDQQRDNEVEFLEGEDAWRAEAAQAKRDVESDHVSENQPTAPVRMISRRVK